MKKKEIGGLLPLNIQFFAENDVDENSEESGTDDTGQNVDEKEDKNKPEEKTFTQSQVTRMMAKEKKEGKNSILKSLGFNNEEEAKKAVSIYNSLLESQKSEEEKNSDKEKKNQSEKDELLKRAEMAEAKLECVNCGVDKDCIEDVLAIASLKVTDDKGLSDILNEMKKDKKYSNFFKNDKSGTGTPPDNNTGSGNKNVGIGKRLAQDNKNVSKKSSYF